MFNSFQLNPIHSQKQFHMVERSGQEGYAGKMQDDKQVEDYYYPSYTTSQNQQHQLKLNLNHNYQQQNYHPDNINYHQIKSKNHHNNSQPPSNQSIHQQMVALKNKYQAALLENSQLIMLLQNKNQQIEQILRQERQRYHMLESQFQQAHRDYTSTITHLENNIKNIQLNIYNQHPYQQKLIQSEHQNQQLIRELDQLKIVYNQKVSELENKIRSIAPLEHNRNIQHPKNNHKVYLPTYEPQQPLNRQPIYSYNTKLRVENAGEIEKYKHDLQFYIDKVQDYDRRTKTLEQVNQGLNLQLKKVLQDRSKSKSILSNVTNNYDLQSQVTQLRNEMSQLKTLTYNHSNLSIPVHSPIRITQNLINIPSQNSYAQIRSPKPSNNQKSSVRVTNQHISPLKNTNLTHEVNKGNKWVQIQQRIGELQHENLKLKKKLHYNK